MKRIIALILVIITVCAILTGCSEADKVNANISKQANYFETERKITVYNARTDKIILGTLSRILPERIPTPITTRCISTLNSR